MGSKLDAFMYCIFSLFYFLIFRYIKKKFRIKKKFLPIVLLTLVVFFIHRLWVYNGYEIVNNDIAYSIIADNFLGLWNGGLLGLLAPDKKKK